MNLKGGQALHTLPQTHYGQHAEGQNEQSGGTPRSGNVPGCCKRCSHYLPQFWTQLGKECSAFGTVEGVNNGCCGFWTPKG